MAVRVLHIEDDAGEALLLEETLRGLAVSARWDGVRAGTLEKGLQLVRRGGFDAILLDLGLPDSEGLATLRAVRAVEGNVPIIVLSGLGDEDSAVQALRDGAQDYLVKGKVTGPALVRVLNNSIARAAIQARLGAARKRAQPQPRTPGAWSRVRLVHVHPAEHDAAITRHISGIGDAGGMVVLGCFAAPAADVRERLHRAGVKTSGILFVEAAAATGAGLPDLDEVALSIESACDQLGVRSQVVLDSLNHIMQRAGARRTVHFMQVVGNRMRALGINLDFVVVDDASGRALASASGGAVDTVMTARAPLRGVSAR